MAALNRKQIICEKLQNGPGLTNDETQIHLAIANLAISPSYPIILIGGTNGKGSTCAFLSTILSHAGYRVGSFTSPHVFEYNERICINNQPVSDNELCQALEQVIQASPVNLGLFKSFTLASHLLFAARKIDIAIVEVGIGGRLDITNLFEPTIAAITSVGLDHCAILGHSIEAIAREKAAIYRPGKPAFYGDNLAPSSLVSHAATVGSKFARFGVEFGVRRHESSWDFYSADLNYYSLPLPSLRGHEQLKNACLALAILTELRWQFPLSLAQIKTGLLTTNLVGRFQVLPGMPQIILDTAHNPQAIETMLKNMLKLQFARRSFALFGVAEDKDWQQILELCLANFDHWYVAPIASERSCPAAQLRNYLLSRGVSDKKIHVYADIETALNQGYQQLNNDDRLVCFGSFLVVEAAYLALQKVR